MNKDIFAFKDLKEIINCESYNINDDATFSFFDISKSDGTINNNKDYSRPLYFCIYEEDYKREGWYTNNFDRRNNIESLFNENINIPILTDNPNILEKYKETHPIIFVEDINKTIDILYKYILEIYNPRVIAVTGSVGKTTLVAMIEEIIATEQSVLRLYSKRLTPINIKCMIINFLKGQENIVLEMSMNQKNHVQKLTELLPPNISAKLNIKNSHIGTNEIKTKKNI